mgnify:CR=1 FL=1
MYCLKCRNKTETKEIVVEGKYKKGICMVCGCKKCIFVKISSGKGIDSEGGKYAGYAKLAYEPVGNRGTNEDRKISTNETAVFLEGDDLIIAYRGTTPSTKDLISDTRILIGTFLNGSRFKRSLQTTTKAMAKYPSKRVILVGHSLGARLSHDIGMMLGVKSYSYNIGSSPVDVKDNLLQALRCKFSSDEEHQKACQSVKENNKSYHTYGDPLSISSLTGHHNTTLIKPKHANIHGIQNFIDDEE